MIKRKKMYCKNCGEEVDTRGIRAPRKCKKCESDIKIVTDFGVVVYIVASVLIAVIIMWIMKSIINNEAVLFIVFAFEVVVIPNLVEKVLHRYNILKYTNVYEK